MHNQTTTSINESPATIGLAKASLACGIGGVVLGPFAGVAAIITGHMALSRIKRSGEVLQGRGMATAGLILGYIFTIISLVFIPILAVVGFAAGNKAISKAKSMSTLAGATGVKTAVDGFVAEYGRMPVDGTADVTLVSEKDAALLNTLLGFDTRLNPKAIRFLRAKEGRNMKGGLIYHAGGRSVTGLYDAFGGTYKIRLDLDHDEKIEMDGKVVSGVRVLVWSDGPDQKAGTADDIKTWAP